MEDLENVKNELVMIFLLLFAIFLSSMAYP
jgi:hypothetical protein